MYGAPALPPDFVALPYANPEAPKGGEVVFGNIGGFDSLNPFVSKGRPPWQLRFWGYESLMGRSADEPFTLYGLLAESIEVPEDRRWVAFTLRPEARFSDGSPVTVEDVIWSYETLGTRGHLRYRSLHSQIETIAQTGPRSLRITFKPGNRELALIAGLRPILKKAQWQGHDFETSGLDRIPIGSGAYVVSDFIAGRQVTFQRNPDYWARDLPFRRGTHNFDRLRIEFYGDASVSFEAFKAGDLDVMRETNADTWATRYDFPAVARGEVVKSQIPNGRPSGMTGLVMNTLRAPFDDWQLREALLLAFNFEFINDAMTGGAQPRFTSYFGNSALALRPGPASAEVAELLAPFAADLLPGTLEGYTLPVGDGTARNRANMRQAARLLRGAGYRVRDGKLMTPGGRPVEIEVLLPQSAGEMQNVVDLYAQALARLGIAMRAARVDEAQYRARVSEQDFDMTPFRRDLSLSPGNEQRLYWGTQSAGLPHSRNLMGMRVPAADAMISAMLATDRPERFTAAVRALDRILMAGRYVIPIWTAQAGMIAHRADLAYPEAIPVYGDRFAWLPMLWWHRAAAQP